MSWIEWALFAVLVAIIGFVVWVVVVVPSCAERGGHEVFSHFQTQVIMVGKVPIVNQIPVYDCVGVG